MVNAFQNELTTQYFALLMHSENIKKMYFALLMENADDEIWTHISFVDALYISYICKKSIFLHHKSDTHR